MEKKSMAAKAWSWVWDWLGNLIWYTADVWEHAVKWVLKWAVDIASMWWDALSKTTDFVTNAITWWNWSNFDAKDWFLDDIQKSTYKALDNNDIIQSDWSKNKAGKLWLQWTELLWEIFVPWLWMLWGLTKWIKAWLKWIKLWKETISILKNSPKAVKAIEELATTAAKAWTKIEQSHVDDIIAKFWKWAVDKAAKVVWEWKVSPKMLSIFSKIKKYTPEQLAEVEKTNPWLVKQFLNWKSLSKAWALWVAEWYAVNKDNWIAMDIEDQEEPKTDEEVKNDIKEFNKSEEAKQFDLNNFKWFEWWVDLKDDNQDNMLPPTELEIENSINELLKTSWIHSQLGKSWDELRKFIADKLWIKNYSDSEKDKDLLLEKLALAKERHDTINK